ncbi:hypothetical protein [uncultured Micrococcus sp.]|uniref:hypothetical protein n=1 Tax=uncultured Micrococcus sp. TaxID=114051 RepID=UPI002635028E|nr:hypothetical protein [uncultured Micrococcus sp.]
MNTQQQTTTVPTGFRVETDGQGEDTLTTIAGPGSGGVTTYIDERDSTVVLSVDGYEKDIITGLDMRAHEARRLVRDLSNVLGLLDDLQRPEVERIARELHARGKRATVDELGQRSHDAGVSVVAVMAAYQALARA